MERKHKEVNLLELFRVVWAQKRRLLRWGIAGLVVGIVVAVSIPKQYQTQTQIAPESTGAAGGSSAGGFASLLGVDIGGAGVASGVTEKLYPQIIQSTPFLLEFKDILIPYKGQQITLYTYLTQHTKQPWWSYVMNSPAMLVHWIGSIGSSHVAPTVSAPRAEGPIDFLNLPDSLRGFASMLKQHTKFEFEAKLGVFKATVTMQSPYASAITADSLIAKLQVYITRYRTSKARADLESNEELLVQARAKYYQASEEYASMMDRNQNLISKAAQVKIEKLSNEKNIAFSVYQQLATQVEANKIKLAEDTPIATIIEPAITPSSEISPNKKVVIVGMALLSMFLLAGYLIVKELIARSKATEEQE